MDRRVSMSGWGYLGLPVAVAFEKRNKTVGFDINPTHISELRSGNDCTHEVSAEVLRAAGYTPR